MMPTETRERLADGIYRTVEPGNPIGLLQEALVLSMTAEPLEKRIRVEGVKTGRITALDLPGQIEQALAIGLVTAAEAAVAARVRPQGHGPHQRGRFRERGTHGGSPGRGRGPAAAADRLRPGRRDDHRAGRRERRPARCVLVPLRP